MGQHIHEHVPKRLTLLADFTRVRDLMDAPVNLSDQSIPRFRDLVERFVAFCDARQVLSLDEVTPIVAHQFVTAKTDSLAAAVATQHLRRSWLRLLFRYARELGLAGHDPTIDLVLPPRSNLACRPLTDDEVAVCRSFSLWSLTNTRRPAAWALAEATVRTAELPHIHISDIDLENNQVFIHGSPRTVQRRGSLSDWGATQLRRRIAEMHARGTGDSAFVIYEGDGSAQSRQASACLAISDTLAAAGYVGERDVRPLSIAAWRGAQVLEETGRIEYAALELGVRSLDRAARLIAFDWRACEDSS